MSLTNAAETALGKLIYQNVAFANIGDAGGLQPSAAAGSFHVALLTGDPGEAGSLANECVYGGYGRVAVARATGGFTVTGNTVSNTAAVTFGAATSGSETASHFALMTASTGGNMINHAALNATLAVSAGITPEFAIGVLQVTLD